MTTPWKVILPLALLLPLGAYFIGSWIGSEPDPAPRPVIEITSPAADTGAPGSPTASRSAAPSGSPSPPADSRPGDSGPGGSATKSARPSPPADTVVPPTPYSDDDGDDDDDGGDDHGDDGGDDSDDGDDDDGDN
ncbi:hypothetical protein [Nocardioides insulae]|uniref:hypothetical protein n=1 Tax=Nocardioides insulae TaxID=394734 RepID=UPI0012FB97D2|nr:hypothetical protein [Nocardioides insulae]